MPLGKTWRQVLEDPETDLTSAPIAVDVESWNSCAVGERSMLLGLTSDDDLDSLIAGSKAWKALLDSESSLDVYVCYRSSPGMAFFYAVKRGDRRQALAILDVVEAFTPGVA